MIATVDGCSRGLRESLQGVACIGAMSDSRRQATEQERLYRTCPSLLAASAGLEGNGS